MTTVVGIGTRKGLFLAHSEDRRTWRIEGPHFPMTEVYALAIDNRGSAPRILAGMTSPHFGPGVAVSDDLGGTWQEPDQPPLALPAEDGEAVRRVWQLVPGPDGSDVVWAGTEPSALFRSTDGGVTYELVRALWDHPHRPRWGAGFGGQAIHSVLPDPADPDRVVVAMSTGGVYRTADGGRSWTPGNRGIRAYFLPDQWPEFGQCVHKIARDATVPDRLYAQNHHGVYRSEDGGASWESIADGLPSDFGFPIVAHPRLPGVVYAFPLTADSCRYPVDNRCRVFRTTDAGRTWSQWAEGLPTLPYFPAVLRDAMCTDDGDVAAVYFGSRSGDVFAAPDTEEPGEPAGTWSTVATHLPDVTCVRAATLGPR